MQEIWKDIPDYKGFYQVSNLGNVKSLNRSIIRSNGVVQSFKGKLMSKCSDGRYLYVTLYKVGKIKNYKIHKLVAIAFLNHKPCGYKFVIDHKDHNPKNNRLNNIRIITQRQNTSQSHIKSSSKFTGVSFEKQTKKWRSTISINGKNKNLGSFTNEIDALDAYQRTLKELQTEINQLKQKL